MWSGFVSFFEQRLQGLSRTHFPLFKDSIQCKKEPWVYVFFSSTTTWAILSWRSFILGTWESGLDKLSTEIQGLSSTDCNFQGLSRPFKVCANPVWFALFICYFSNRMYLPKPTSMQKANNLTALRLQGFALNILCTTRTLLLETFALVSCSCRTFMKGFLWTCRFLRELTGERGLHGEILLICVVPWK